MSASAVKRSRMVSEQIAARGVRDPRVLHAMGVVPRECFVPAGQREFAYEDNALGIGSGQTISQPYIVALMAEALELKGDEKVLEIGTGSGYAAAVLGTLCRQVFTVERHFDLARTAAECLEETGFRNVIVIHGDGTLGLPAHGPFDAIAVAAGGPRVPEALKDQLVIGGRIVIPVGADRGLQTLLRVRRISEREYQQDDLGPVRFVPLIGAQGFGVPATESPG
jgi:protein-L-isoaspartate(D-aspartate) O-methyltransferase